MNSELLIELFVSKQINRNQLSMLNALLCAFTYHHDMLFKLLAGHVLRLQPTTIQIFTGNRIIHVTIIILIKNLENVIKKPRKKHSYFIEFLWFLHLN